MRFMKKEKKLKKTNRIIEINIMKPDKLVHTKEIVK